MINKITEGVVTDVVVVEIDTTTTEVNMMVVEELVIGATFSPILKGI